jgi:hypothetical protein
MAREAISVLPKVVICYWSNERVIEYGALALAPVSLLHGDFLSRVFPPIGFSPYFAWTNLSVTPNTLRQPGNLVHDCVYPQKHAMFFVCVCDCCVPGAHFRWLYSAWYLQSQCGL